MTQDSIWYNKTGEFKSLVHGFDKTITVSEAIGGFKEFRNISKDFKQMTIGQVIDNKLIEELFNALRNGMKSEAKFELQYKKEERIHELIDTISEEYIIDKEKAETAIVTGHYEEGNNGRVFNYCLEVVIVPRGHVNIDSAGEVKIIGNVNSSASIDGGEKYFDGFYGWYDRKSRWIETTSIRGILAQCGFNRSETYSKRKQSSILYINLLTPCPDWLGGAGKSHIDITPYADDIAKTVSTLAYKIPSYHGKVDYIHEYSIKEKSAISYLEEFLRNRYKTIQADPSLKYRDPLTQSGVWYRMRPIMIRNGFEPEKDWGQTRNYLTSLIDTKCRELFGDDFEREYLAIYAKAKGMMLYNGNVYPISFSTFEALGQKGVFILVIEKEGIADSLKNPARNSGVALVHTGGQFPKYVKWLTENTQVPIATLTDYDADGVDMAARVDIPRIGIDMDIISWLHENKYDLTQENVEEEYTPRIEPKDEYIKHHRIELDSIIAAFPDEPERGPEALWKYVKYKIEEQQKDKGFDYNNDVVDKPEKDSLYPTIMKHIISKLESYIEEITEDETEEIEKEQEAVKELISIKEKERENFTRLEKVVSEDEIIQEQIVPMFRRLYEELSEVLDDE